MRATAVLPEWQTVPVELATPAFVLRTRPYGESDLIVTFITERHGKLTGIGKGARNSPAPLPGNTPALPARAARLQPAVGDGLAFLLRCELLESLRGITHELERYAAGSYVLDLTDRMVAGPGVGRRGLRPGARGARPARGRRAARSAAARRRAAPAARERLRAGVRPLPAVRRTPPDTALFLAVERGGLLCRRCVPPNERVVPVGAETAALLTGSPPARWRRPPAGTVSKRRAGSPGAAGGRDVGPGALASLSGPGAN